MLPDFRNLIMYSPNGKKDGIQIIPLPEVAAKDEFLNIKNASLDGMMAAHRGWRLFLTMLEGFVMWKRQQTFLSEMNLYF